MILDPVFILILGMGVRGAAIATIISQLISCAAILIALFVSRGRPFEHFSFRFRPEPEKIVMLLKWAVPIGLESIVFCFLTMLCSRMEASFGAGALAAGKIGGQIESLSWLLGGGFSSALVAFIGQNFGAGKQERIRRGVKISFLVMAIWGCFVTLLLFVLGPAIFVFFLPAPELASLGKFYVYIAAFCQLSINMEAVAAGAFKGTGRTIPPSLASIVSNTAKPILAWLLSRTSLGVYGVWIGNSASALIRGVWVCVWYLLAERRSRSTKATTPYCPKS